MALCRAHCASDAACCAPCTAWDTWAGLALVQCPSAHSRARWAACAQRGCRSKKWGSVMGDTQAGRQEQEAGIDDGGYVQAGSNKKWGLMMGDMCRH